MKAVYLTLLCDTIKMISRILTASYLHEYKPCVYELRALAARSCVDLFLSRSVSGYMSLGVCGLSKLDAEPPLLLIPCLFLQLGLSQTITLTVL
jgi:hypothetical protein